MAEQYPYIPRFSTFLPSYDPSTSATPARALPAEVPATGTGNWFTSGIMSGFHGAVSEGARALQAAAQLAGSPDTAQSLSDFATAAHEREQSYARPDLEASPWSLPGIGYNIARMVPMGVAALGGGALATAAAPEAAAGAGATALGLAARTALIRGAGAAAATYPFVTGANVQRQISETGELTAPGKALALGVPEAAVQGILPGKLESFFGKGILSGIAHSAAAQGGAGGATEAMTQLMGDPNRGFADRASAIVSQTLGGAALGGIIGGGHAGFRTLVGRPVGGVSNEDLGTSVDQALEPQKPAQLTYQPQMRAPLTDTPSGEIAGRIDTLQRQPPRTQAEAEELRQLVQEQERRAAEAAAAEAEKPPPQKLLPPPATKEGPPLQEMPPDELWKRFNNVQERLTLNPQDPDALRAFESLGQEFTRRVAETPPAEPVPPPPAQLTYQPGMRGPLTDVPGGEIAGRIDTLQRQPPRTQAEAEELRQLVQEQQRREAEAASAAAEAPGPQKLLGPPSTKEGPPLEAMAPADLWARLSAVRSHLAVNPEDTAAQRASELLGQEFSRRVEETAKAAEPAAPAAAEPAAAEPTAAEPAAAEPAAPAAPAAPVPVLDFTKGRLKEGTALYAKAPPEAQAAMRQPLMDAIVARAGEGKEPTKLQERWADALDIWDEFEKAVPERPSEVPPGVTEEAPPAAPIAPAAAEPLAPPAPPPASTAPIRTAEDRAAALNGIQAHIDRIVDPEIQAKHAAEAETIAALLPNIETNPGMALSASVRLNRLRNAVEAEAQRPADQVASPDLAPSPRAEAVPAPTGDLGARLEDAQSALSKLKKALGNRADAVEAIDQHASWLADVNKATGPDELRAALAKDPEALAAAETPGVADLGGLTQLSQPQKKQMAAYLSTQEKVLQELRAQSDSRARVIASRDGLPVTQLDADVTDLHQRGVPLTDVADHIIEHVADPEQAEIVAKLKPFLPKDAKTVFRDGVADKEGEYFTKQKTSALYNAADATTTSIHEMAHAVMHRALEGDSAAARAMRGIYDQLEDTGNHAGITDAHEMVSEAMANPTYRNFLKSQMVKGTSLWDRMIDTVRGFIGLDPRLFNAFDRIMSHGDDLMREQRTYPNEWLGPDSYARVANEGTGTTSAAADKIEDTLLRRFSESMGDGTFNARGKVRKFVLGFMRGEWLAKDPVFSKLSPDNLPGYVAALKNEDPRKAQIAGAAAAATRQSDALPAEAREAVNEVMALSASYGYHPDRSLADYKEIHNDPVEVQKFNAVKDSWNRAGQIPGAQEAYNTWRQTMSALGNMSAVLNLQATERLNPALNAVDSFKKFDLSDDANKPKRVNENWQTELNDKIKAGKAFNDTLSAAKADIDTKLAAVEFKKDQPKELVKQSADLGSQIDRLSGALKEAEDQQKRMFKAPYFHLGREGDFFATGKLVTKPGEIDPETGKPGKAQVDKDTLSKFHDYLERNGITDVAILQGNDNDTFYSRVKSPSEMRELARVLEGAQKEGWLSKTEPIKRGGIFDPQIFERVSSTAAQRILDQLRENPPVAPAGASPDFAAGLSASHATEIQNAQRALLSMAPETSMSRLMAHRQNVQGFSKDMIRSQEFAAEVSAFNIARQSLGHEVRGFEGGLLKDAEKVNDPAATPGISDNTRLGFSDTVAELMRQQRSRETFVPRSPIDAARQLTNFLHIGMQPSYALMQLGQLAMTGIPELAKTHGYGPAFAAMYRALPEAMRALYAVAKSPDGLTAGITREALENGQLPQGLTNTIMGAVRRGAMGTYTAAVTERSPWTQGIGGTALKAANVMGLYSDLAPRLVMALAADKLYKESPHRSMTHEEFIDNAAEQSQGYWGGALSARQMGKTGPLGAYTPATFQFGQWNIHMTSKLYHEVYNAFAGEDAQTKKEALTYLGGHAAATTMLAGTLGLPAVSVMASAYDWFMNKVTGRDDHDITASYRNFLANTFGKDIGEVIARGAPRAAGVDFANWGEGEIIPGSSALNVLMEKRKLEDVENDWFKSIGGPAADQIFKFGQAARDFTNGDVLEGLIKMSPGLIGGPVKAYKLGQAGFVDSHGQKLPISSPRAYDFALTALGLKPAKQAEYQEVARDESGLRAMREASSANISQHLRQAWTLGDQGSFNAWMGEAQRWQIQHPGLVPPQASFASALNNHMRQLSQARGMGLPIGVAPQDIAGRGTLQYGNLPVQ